MKHLLLSCMVILFSHCSFFEDVAGTSTDVNSGSILGVVKNDGTQYKSQVEVMLFSAGADLAKRTSETGTPLKTVVTNDGTFSFDSLADGEYFIRVEKDSLTINDETNVAIKDGGSVNIEISVSLIIQQEINIARLDKSIDVIVNNFNFTGIDGRAETTGQGPINLFFTEADTIQITAEIRANNQSMEIRVTFIKQADGSYVLTPSETEAPVYIVRSDDLNPETRAFRGMVAHWDFNQISDGNVKDQSGNGHHLFVAGGNLMDGILGKAYRFGGSESQGDVSRLLEVDGKVWYAKDYSYEAIFSPANFYSAGPEGQIILQSATQNGVYALKLEKDTIMAGNKYEMPVDWRLVKYALSPSDLEEYIYIAVTYEYASKAIKLYVDGEQKGSITGSGDIYSYKLAGNVPTVAYYNIKGQSYGPCRFAGAIDDIKLYNKVLSEKYISETWKKLEAQMGLR